MALLNGERPETQTALTDKVFGSTRPVALGKVCTGIDTSENTCPRLVCAHWKILFPATTPPKAPSRRRHPRLKAGKPSLGFLNPLLYESYDRWPDVVHDVRARPGETVLSGPDDQMSVAVFGDPQTTWRLSFWLSFKTMKNGVASKTGTPKWTMDKMDWQNTGLNNGTASCQGSTMEQRVSNYS